MTVQVRLRWDEEAGSYQDAGSTYTYTGSYSGRQFDTEDLFGMIWEGTGEGAGPIGDRIGAHIIDDEGPVRLLALNVERLPYRTTGTVTMLPANETISVSDESAIGLLCDDRNWLIGREVAGQPGSFSMACSLNIAQGNATLQTVVSGILSAPGAKPRIAGVRFEQQDVVTGEWRPFAGNPGTVDGNQVRVIATIENGGGAPYTLPVRFLDGESLQQLPDGSVELTINPGQIVEVTYQWDTEGWGWDRPAAPNGGAHPNRVVEVRLGSDAVLYDSWSEPIVVRAKPVFLSRGCQPESTVSPRRTSFKEARAHCIRKSAVPVGFHLHPLRAGLQTRIDTIVMDPDSPMCFLIEELSVWHFALPSPALVVTPSPIFLPWTAPCRPGGSRSAHRATLHTP